MSHGQWWESEAAWPAADEFSDLEDTVSESNAVHEPRRGDGEKTPRTSPALFVRQSIAELRKVVWPTQEQLVTYFIVTMVFVVFMMAFVALLDLGFGKLAFELFTK